MIVTNKKSLLGQVPLGATLALSSLLAVSTHAAVPGITGPTFNLNAAPMRSTQPNGKSVYTWGYGCTTRPDLRRELSAAQPVRPRRCPGRR